MRGTTLVELLVVLLVLGMVAGVSALAVAGLRMPAESGQGQLLARTRSAVIRSGQAASVELDGGRVVRFLPDGRAIGAGVDPLTGELLGAKQ